MNDLLSTAGRNSNQTVELALAAVEVVFRRMTLGGFAMVNPAGADHVEFARMVPEKAQAFSDAGSIMMSRSAEIGHEMARFMTEQMKFAAQAASAVLTASGPAGMIAAQADASMSLARRLTMLPQMLGLLALETQAAAMAPIHRTATDNVARLRNRDATS
jgi:hypothetical protein